MNVNRAISAVTHGFSHKAPFELETVKTNNMYDQIDVRNIEVHGLTDKEEDIVIFQGMHPDKGRSFIMTTSIPRTKSDDPGDAGSEFAQLFTDKTLVLANQTDKSIIWRTQ